MQAVSGGKHARGGGGYLSPQIAMIAVRKGGRGKLGSNRVALMGEPSAIAAERFPHGFSGGSFTPENSRQFARLQWQESGSTPAFSANSFVI